ncbi:eukaryotic aspartyl protease family protein [Actinidia rufa]|uniref:Eukaryotic aspartyl protease family protein n=1 Tax=Actinidia rufa TaxID=165716 RepID=A0A7J0H414_9ERIC|nr:eukaryotic aspartyl protease family protein [Actinidia rufa]
MPGSIAAGFSVFLAFSALALPAAVVLCGFPGGADSGEGLSDTTSQGGLGMSQLRKRDRVRHRRFLQSYSGVVDFPVEGTYDPYLVGLYFTRVQLGSPPTEFHVQIDTGSDVLWIPLNFFNPLSSATASPISCSDQRCALGAQSADSGCSTQNNQCSYTFQYGDGSGTSGYYVSDLMHLETVVGNSLTSNSSASIVFGCSTSQMGDLTKSDRAVDGIFGFGQQGLSVISQLSSQGITPMPSPIA